MHCQIRSPTTVSSRSRSRFQARRFVSSRSDCVSTRATSTLQPYSSTNSTCTLALRSVERASRELDARVPSSVLKAGSRYVREGERDPNVRWTPDASESVGAGVRPRVSCDDTTRDLSAVSQVVSIYLEPLQPSLSIPMHIHPETNVLVAS